MAKPLNKISTAVWQSGKDQAKSQSGAGSESRGLLAKDTRVQMYKDMFREEWDKPFWKDLREQVPIDFGYYTGSGQWTEEQRSDAKSKGRPTLSLNHILPALNVLFGLERLNRYDPVAAPKAKDAVSVAELFTRIMKQEMDNATGEYIMSQGFGDGVICGVKAFELPISYLEDPVRGDIELLTVEVPGELIWSTPWKRYDLNDCRAMWRHQWVDVDVLLAEYPKYRADIVAALDGVKALTAQDATKERAVLSEGNPKDHYEASDATRPQDDLEFWFDVKKNRVKLLEVYFPEYYPTWILWDKGAKRVIKSSSEIHIRRFFEAMAAKHPRDEWEIIERNERKIYEMICLPATDFVLEEGIAYDKDQNGYPFVPFFAYWRGHEIFGVVRNLRDPQDEINARRSQISWLTKASGDGWFADENSMTDLKSFESQSRDPKGVYSVRRNAKDPRRMPPPNVPQGLFTLLAEAINEIRSISLVNPDLQGLESNSQSGVQGARRAQQGQIGNTEVFDNYKLTKRLLWKKWARRIQERYTDEEVVRLFNADSGEYDFVEVNQRVPVGESEVPSGVVRYRVLNDISSLKYDIQITEVPISPTHRAGALATLSDLMQKLPAIAPLIVDTLVEMTDGIPDHDKVVARVKRWVEAQMGEKKAPPPKVTISLKGEDIPEEARVVLARKAADEPDPRETQNPLGAEAGNVQNPSGQIPTGGQKLNERADLPPPGA